MRRTGRRVTLQTIADAVGVSRTTVSNAYSRPDQLAPALRERILATAEELGYAGPDAAARTLRRGRAGAIGLLFTETLGYMLSDPFAVSFLHGIAETAEQHAASLLLTSLREDSPDAVGDAIVDGFCVYCVADDTAALRAIRRRGLPVVQSRKTDEPGAAYVAIDDRRSAATAAEHLLGLGHRRLGLLVDWGVPEGYAGPVDPRAIEAIPSSDARDRLLGYLDAVRAAGLDPAQVMVVRAKANTTEDGTEAARRLLTLTGGAGGPGARHAPPTGLLAFSDMLAIGALAAVREQGGTPGREVSVVGFDDVPAAAAADLTTIHQPGREKGRTAGLVLLAPPADPERRRIVLPTELVVRASSGPPTDRNHIEKE
jgi:DNA-binding LacI/PurR family transcriptional regulator